MSTIRADNRRRRKHGETILIYGAGEEEPLEDRVTDVLADIGHFIGPKRLRDLAERAARHVETERWEARQEARQGR